MKKIFTASALAIAALSVSPIVAVPAAAQVPFNPAAPENRQVMPTFNYDTVETVLRQILRELARS